MLALYALAAVILLLVLVAALSSGGKGNAESSGKQSGGSSEPASYTYSKKQYILTKNEHDFYKHLLPIATNRGYTVCPKVRLADVIEPQRGSGQNQKGAFARIQSKHIDFLLCQGALSPVLAIELDDNSHDTGNRAERDNFVDEALTSAKIPILRTRGTGDLNKRISDVLG